MTEIDTGPRFEALGDAVRQAIEDFDAPLEEAELDGGWTDEGRLEVLAELRASLERLGEDPRARLARLDELVGDEVDVDVDGRTGAVMTIEFAQGDLALAEEVLGATLSFLDELGVAIEPRDAAHGFDEPTREAIRAVATDVAHTLAAGGYLTSELGAAWDTVLTERGLQRQVVNDEVSPIFGGPAAGRAGDMALWPPGPRWESVVLYDNSLQQLLRRDLALED